MSSDPFSKHSDPRPCACRFIRSEDFGETDQVERCALHDSKDDRIQALEAALKPFADAFEYSGVQQYSGVEDEDFNGFLDRNEITSSQGITMRQFRLAWEAITGKSATNNQQE